MHTIAPTKAPNDPTDMPLSQRQLIGMAGLVAIILSAVAAWHVLREPVDGDELSLLRRLRHGCQNVIGDAPTFIVRGATMSSALLGKGCREVRPGSRLVQLRNWQNEARYVRVDFKQTEDQTVASAAFISVDLALSEQAVREAFAAGAFESSLQQADSNWGPAFGRYALQTWRKLAAEEAADIELDMRPFAGQGVDSLDVARHFVSLALELDDALRGPLKSKGFEWAHLNLAAVRVGSVTYPVDMDLRMLSLLSMPALWSQSDLPLATLDPRTAY